MPLQGGALGWGSCWGWQPRLFPGSAPWPSAYPLSGASFALHSSSGDRHVECAQESAPCTVSPGPRGSPASSSEPSSPESEARGPSPRPSPLSSQEGSPQLWSHHPGSVLPTWMLDTSSPSFLETDGAEPTSLEKEKAGEAPSPGKEVKSEDPAGTAEAGARQPDVLLTSTEG